MRLMRRYIEVFQSTDADFERARDPSVKLLDKNRQERLKPQTDQGWLGPGWIPTNNFYEMRGYGAPKWLRGCMRTCVCRV